MIDLLRRVAELEQLNGHVPEALHPLVREIYKKWLFRQ